MVEEKLLVDGVVNGNIVIFDEVIDDFFGFEGIELLILGVVLDYYEFI